MNDYAKRIAEAVRDAAAEALLRRSEQSQALGEYVFAVAERKGADVLRRIDLDAIIASVPGPWLPIDDAPKEGEFLVYMPDEITKIQAAKRIAKCFVIGNAFAFDLTKPTLYMMPPQPKESHEQD